MKREGKRGEESGKKISWDEALAAITKELADLRMAGNPQSVACITGTDQGTIPSLIGRFLTAYGSPNFIRSATARTPLNRPST